MDSAGGTPTSYEYAYDGRLGTYFRSVGEVSVRFHDWQAKTLYKYDTMLITVVYSVTASTNDDPWTISYSTDGGSTWSVIATGIGLSTYEPDTESIEVVADLDDLQVKVECPDGKTIRIYEIYTTGCYYPSPSASVSESPSASISPSPGVPYHEFSSTYRNRTYYATPINRDMDSQEISRSFYALEINHGVT